MIMMLKLKTHSPKISDFTGNFNQTLMSNSSQSSNTIINGKISTQSYNTQRFSYSLKADKPGVLYKTCNNSC